MVSDRTFFFSTYVLVSFFFTSNPPFPPLSPVTSSERQFRLIPLRFFFYFDGMEFQILQDLRNLLILVALLAPLA